jgi:hypothetical protein
VPALADPDAGAVGPELETEPDRNRGQHLSARGAPGVGWRYLELGLDAALTDDPRPKPAKLLDAGQQAVVAFQDRSRSTMPKMTKSFWSCFCEHSVGALLVGASRER